MKFSIFFLLSLFVAQGLCATQLAVDIANATHQVSPSLFGVSFFFLITFVIYLVTKEIFFEEINHAGEGGLYGELGKLLLFTCTFFVTNLSF
jgi:hypothetical protein